MKHPHTSVFPSMSFLSKLGDTIKTKISWNLTLAHYIICFWIYLIELFHSAAPDFVEKFAAGKTRVDVLSYTREEKWDQPELSCKNGHISHWKMAKLPLLVLYWLHPFCDFSRTIFPSISYFFILHQLSSLVLIGKCFKVKKTKLCIQVYSLYHLMIWNSVDFPC